MLNDRKDLGKKKEEKLERLRNNWYIGIHILPNNKIECIPHQGQSVTR